MLTIEELNEMISLLEKEKQWILTTTAYYNETPDVLDKILQSNYKDKLKLLDSLITKLNNIKVEIQ